MGRLGTGVLLAALVIPLAVALDDPEGDVTRNLSEPAHAPYVDILAINWTTHDDRLDLSMRLAAPATDAPRGMRLQFLWPFALDGQDDNVFGQTDGTVLCAYETDSGALACHDSSASFTVIRAGRTDKNVTATVDLAGAPVGNLVVAGAASRIEDGNVTAQDFTDNALPYRAGRDALGPAGPALEAKPWWQSSRIAWFFVIALGGAYGYRRWSGRD